MLLEHARVNQSAKRNMPHERKGRNVFFIILQEPVWRNLYIYRKIPIISPGITFVQKAFLLGLFSWELIFGRAYYWREFYVSKRVGLDNKKSF